MVSFVDYFPMFSWWVNVDHTFLLEVGLFWFSKYGPIDNGGDSTIYDVGYCCDTIVRVFSSIFIIDKFEKQKCDRHQTIAENVR